MFGFGLLGFAKVVRVDEVEVCKGNFVGFGGVFKFF